jgi:WD40 repeat protein
MLMQIKKIFFLSLIVLLTCHYSKAQKQANNWLFGMYGWISFNSGAPQALSGGQFSNLEGSASISDANGKLLFYTNGISVWNNRHFTMPNGSDLMGSPSSTQSAVIVPSPSDKNQYYVFTIDDCIDSLAYGFRYSIVDMTLSNGLGDVTTKNQLLHSMTTEKITAVMHQDNQSIWVVTHGYKNNEFYSYLLTKSGIQFKPVVSTVGSIHYGSLLSSDVCGSLGSARGYMKTSPDGKRIALAVTRSDFVEIFDFDNTTGRVSNPSKIKIKEPYGLEFSPDGSLLYIGGWKDLPIQASLFQIDLTNNHITTLMAAPDFEFGAVQVGPDQKLYVYQME